MQGADIFRNQLISTLGSTFLGVIFAQIVAKSGEAASVASMFVIMLCIPIFIINCSYFLLLFLKYAKQLMLLSFFLIPLCLTIILSISMYKDGEFLLNVITFFPIYLNVFFGLFFYIKNLGNYR